jgi:HPt (histidine-containing phosphotransfer) domain-containing protein
MATAAADAPKSAFELNVPGIDSNAALRRMLGRTDIYLRTLRVFCEQQDGTAKAMRQALDANDPVTAHRLVHTLKGLAGSIGADSLASQAAEVERTISTHQPRAKIDVGVISLEAAVRQLIAAVGPWLPPQEAPPADSNSASIDEFEQLLAASDPESLSWLLRNAAALRAQLQDAGIKEIEKAVRNFDLDQALQLVQQARNQERKS